MRDLHLTEQAVTLLPEHNSADSASVSKVLEPSMAN